MSSRIQNTWFVSVVTSTRPEDFICTEGIILQNGPHAQAVFALSALYPLQPRGLFSVDLMDGSIRKSDSSGFLITSTKFFDLDGDGKPEILTSGYAPENIHFPVSYSDSSAWLMIYDMEFNHFFEPVEFPHITSSVQTFAQEDQPSNPIGILYNYYGTRDIGPHLSYYDIRGNRKKHFQLPDKASPYYLIEFPQKKCLINQRGEIFKIGNDGPELIRSSNSIIPISAVVLVNVDWFIGSEAILFGKGQINLLKYDLELVSALKPEIQYHVQSTTTVKLPGSRDRIHVDTSASSCDMGLTPRKDLIIVLLSTYILLSTIFTVLLFRARTTENFSLPVGKSTYIFGPQDIFFFRAEGRYTAVVQSEKTDIITLHLKGVEKHLPTYFCRINRSIILNLKYIKSVDAFRCKINTPFGEFDIQKDKIESIERIVKKSVTKS